MSELSAPVLRRPLAPRLGLPIRLCESSGAADVGSFDCLRTVTLGWGICESGLPPDDSLCDGVEVVEVGLAAACEAKDGSAEREMPLSDKLALGGESPAVEPSEDRLR